MCPQVNSVPGQVWHCLSTAQPAKLLAFYNQLGLALSPLQKHNEHGLSDIFVSSVAPLCIRSHDTSGTSPSILLWTELKCPEFQDAFPSIAQSVEHNLAEVEMKNVCNFNSLIRCPDIDLTQSRFSRCEWVREKHGAGPEHFHSCLGVHQIEIYPLRRGQGYPETMNLEFYFEIPTMAVLGPEKLIEGRRIWTLSDPDGRTFVAGLPQKNG
eukprot:maker-scaffold675_size187964-snap-gene-0.34 protein:Tk03274 transcript:maker-scaffold675_size187964-snap-gene-0.34-mRNA-1 annotation:"guanosine polyphosphate pyrophosphohydrolase"